MTKEIIAKSICEYPQYKATKCGEIIGVYKSERGYMRQHTRKTGYKCVTVRNAGVANTRYVHRLVWIAFNGSIPEGKFINHIDGIKSNNSLDNLELVTPKENTAHAIKMGLIKPMDKKGYAAMNRSIQLTADQDEEVKRLYEAGLSMRAVGRELGICHKTVSGIVNQTGVFRARPDNRNKVW